MGRFEAILGDVAVIDGADDVPDLSALDDQRLSELVTRTDRASARARRRTAVEPQTRAFVQAGLALIAKHFSREMRISTEGDETVAPYFAWLSRPKIAAEVDLSRLPDGEALRGMPEVTRIETIVGRMRSRWEPHRNYIADLLATALALEHWSTPTYQNRELVDSLKSDDLIGAIHEVACSDLEGVVQRNVATFRIQLIATAIADREESLRAALEQGYDQVNAGWAEAYAEAIAAHGLVLRQGITMDDLTHMLTAAAEGLSLRLLLNPESPVLDADRRRSLLGVMALSLVGACLTLPGDETSLEDFVGAGLAQLKAAQAAAGGDVETPNTTDDPPTSQ